MNLAIFEFGKSTTVISFDFTEEKKFSGEFLIRSFFHSEDTPEFNVASLNAGGNDYFLSTDSGEQWILDFAQAYLHVHVESTTPFDKTYTLNEIISEVKDSSTVLNKWNLDFKLKTVNSVEEDTPEKVVQLF